MFPAGINRSWRSACQSLEPNCVCVCVCVKLPTLWWAVFKSAPALVNWVRWERAEQFVIPEWFKELKWMTPCEEVMKVIYSCVTLSFIKPINPVPHSALIYQIRWKLQQIPEVYRSSINPVGKFTTYSKTQFLLYQCHFGAIAKYNYLWVFKQ